MWRIKSFYPAGYATKLPNRLKFRKEAIAQSNRTTSRQTWALIIFNHMRFDYFYKITLFDGSVPVFHLLSPSKKQRLS
ncbi:hypothetical protein BJP42_05220 [Candidatus Williamhamiltonella defendens]|nr:hypothetical protein BJP42_05220 [Candidatus Hamiltonella defensa]